MEKAIKNLKGFFFALVLFLVLTMAAAALMKFTSCPESWSLIYMMVALCVSCLFLGIYSGGLVRRKGFLYGALYSIIFLGVILVIYLLFFPFEPTLSPGILKFLLCLLCGSIGGMIGVNLRI